MNNIKNRKERKQTHTHNEYVDSGRRKELLHEIRRLNVIYCMWELISYFIHQTTPDYFSVSFCVLHVCMYVWWTKLWWSLYLGAISWFCRMNTKRLQPIKCTTAMGLCPIRMHRRVYHTAISIRGYPHCPTLANSYRFVDTCLEAKRARALSQLQHIIPIQLFAISLSLLSLISNPSPCTPAQPNNELKHPVIVRV